MSKIRLGLIGCGGMAKNHVSRLDPLRTRLDLTAAVDVVESQAAAVAQHFDGAKVATDYRDILDDVDAVLLVLPHQLHHPAAMACLAAGKHVLVEKPMANTEQQCLEMIDAAKTADRVLMVAYCVRYHPLVRQMKELIDTKTYGDCFHVSIWTEQHTEREPDNWMCRADTLGGGQLFSHGCHYIDVLLWFMGKPVCGTHVGTNYGTSWMEKEGTSNVSMKFESGATAYHFGTWGAKGSRLKYSYHAHCTGGMIELAYSEGKLIAHVDGEEKLLGEDKTAKPTEREMAHFLDCIETRQTPITNGPASVQGLRVIWRMYDAEEKGVVADLRGLGLDDA